MNGNGIGEPDDEQRCRNAGDLVERALLEARPSLSAAGWERLQDALVAPSRRSAGRSRRRRWLVPALAVVALGGVAALWLLRARPLTFEVQGGAGVDRDGRVATAPERRATVRFSDGSAVTLAGASSGRVVALTADGARFAVERGRARFEVVHRARTRWSVAAGPFEVLVTGTAFDVDWTGEPAAGSGRARARRLLVDLHSGAITVRGALAGAGVSLRAGQRLLADLDHGRLAIVDQSEANAGAGPIDGASAPGAAAVAAGAELVGPGGSVRPSAADDGAREGNGDRSRALRGEAPAAGVEPAVAAPAGAAPSAATPGQPPATAPGEGPIPERPALEPAPWPAPSLTPETKVAAGGASCLGWAPQIRFDRSDRSLAGIKVASEVSQAFTHPAIDRGRSWCGAGALRVDARFDLAGALNRLGQPPRHSGEVLVDLPAAVDLTGHTVTVHFFVEGPTDLRFGAQLFAVDGSVAGDPKWVGGGFIPDLTTGRWWTLTHAFQRENRLFEGGTSPVDHVEKLSLQLYAIGKDRVWTGRVYVDDLGWQ